MNKIRYKSITFLIFSLHILLISILNYTYSSNIIKTSNIEFNSSFVSQKRESLTKYLNLVENKVNEIQMAPILLMELDTELFNPDVILALDNYRVTTPGLQSIHYVTDSKNYISTAFRSKGLGIQVRAQNSTGWHLSPQIDNPEINILNYEFHFYDSNEPEKHGYILVEIDSDYLKYLLSNNEESDKNIQLSKKSVSLLSNIRSNGVQYEVYNHEQIYIYAFEKRDLELVQTSSTREVDLELATLRRNILLSSVILLLASFFVSHLLINMILNPLDQILLRFSTTFKE